MGKGDARFRAPDDYLTVEADMVIPGVSAPSSTTPAATAAGLSGLGGLNQSDFLTLLTKQLQYQNPLEPMSSSDFATQLAQLSTVDSMQQLNSTMGNMLLLQSITQGASLIGKQISYGSGSQSGQGKVDSVQVANGQLVLMVGGNAVPLNEVQGVNQAT
jgi:flagellar basal-body rod modification protein FlgD